MRIVLITRPVVRLPNYPVVAGAVIVGARAEPTPRGNARVWLDLNMLGVRIPQMYQPDEFEDATPELLDQHNLCRACRGYGLLELRADITELNSPDVCPACDGSGSTTWRTTITEDADGSHHGTLTQTAWLHGPAEGEASDR